VTRQAQHTLAENRFFYSLVRLHKYRMSASSFAIKAAVVAAVPLLACSTYYTLDRIGNAGPALYVAASLSLPVMLLGLVGTARTVASGNKKRLQIWASGLAVALPAILLAFIWL
jgi:hypothetical protein